MRASPDSPRMFASDVLDVLTRTPWWTVPLVWLPVTIALFGVGLFRYGVPPLAGLASAVGGWAVWSLTEYWLHRTVFHWRPGSRFHFFVHGVHHDWPNDRYRLVLPPTISMVLGSLVGCVFWLALGGVWWWTAFAGFTAGYMVYDLVHYAIHHARSGSRVFQALKRHHLLHHFSPAHVDRRFGVSMTLWDHAFRTW